MATKRAFEATRGSRAKAAAIFVIGPIAMTVLGPGLSMTHRTSASTPSGSTPPRWSSRTTPRAKFSCGCVGTPSGSKLAVPIPIGTSLLPAVASNPAASRARYVVSPDTVVTSRRSSSGHPSNIASAQVSSMSVPMSVSKITDVMPLLQTLTPYRCRNQASRLLRSQRMRVVSTASALLRMNLPA